MQHMVSEQQKQGRMDLWITGIYRVMDDKSKPCRDRHDGGDRLVARSNARTNSSI